MTTRKNIYYWKCDRVNTFYALSENKSPKKLIEDNLKIMLDQFFKGKSFELISGKGQGNHLTFLAICNGVKYFIRIEDGPEKDDYMEVETEIIRRVSHLGVPTVKIYQADSSREKVPFAYQITEYVDSLDLNELYKKGLLNVNSIMYKIGQAVACWQQIIPPGFGPFDADLLRRKGQLEGLHEKYENYYFLNWEKHLSFLEESTFLSKEEGDRIGQLVKDSAEYIPIKQGCLVHKDLALWNILGATNQIRAFIDWDDCISGDPMDDLSLLGCFFSGEMIEIAIRGYESQKALPENYQKRFWLHLLRNMIFKTVIRVGAGYFDKQDNFFLIGSQSDGKSLEEFTRDRIRRACDGISGHININDL